MFSINRITNTNMVLNIVVNHGGTDTDIMQDNFDDVAAVCYRNRFYYVLCYNEQTEYEQYLLFEVIASAEDKKRVEEVMSRMRRKNITAEEYLLQLETNITDAFI